MSGNQKTYTKHVYWLQREEVDRLREDLSSRGVTLRSAKGVVCTPLDRINRITLVAPEVWSETCARQGSWYRTSEKNGLYLLVSAFELESYERQKAARITESDFIPPRHAAQEDKRALIMEMKRSDRIPPEWEVIPEKEKRIYLRWAHRLGSDVRDYERLYLSHTANHANFISPRFFIEDRHGIMPYSIDRSAHLCSCCVELFQVLGAEYERKMVAPCPGATIFARLKPDRYLLVERC
jgi:hypothetical protein